MRKRTGTSNIYALYDESGHWLGDYGNAGHPIQQAIWMDDAPVGLLANGGQVHYVQPDHLGTPRAVIDPVRDVAVWMWGMKGEAFGTTLPEQDADGDGVAFTLDIRFPGQRYDSSSGLNQNYFRDHEPGSGRYAQSDPLGLRAGTSTYLYVLASPLARRDPLGLASDKPGEYCEIAMECSAEKCHRETCQLAAVKVVKISAGLATVIDWRICLIITSTTNLVLHLKQICIAKTIASRRNLLCMPEELGSYDYS